jgi:ribonuclease Z
MVKRSLSCLLISLATICCPRADAGLFVESSPQYQLLKDGRLHIFILGTGAPETEMQEIRKPSCVALIADGKMFFFDAGEGSVQTAASIGLPYERVSKIFMTHWHSDHFGGLGQLLNASWLHGRTGSLDVYGPTGTKKVLDGLKQAYELDTGFRAATIKGALDPKLSGGIPHDIIANASGTQVYSDSKLQISCFTVKHTPVVPAFGYEITYGGTKIVISGDTAVVESLEKHSQHADVLISEAFSRPLAKVEAERQHSTRLVDELSSYHADTLDLAKMAQRASVKHLVLTHMVPSIATTDEAKHSFMAGMSALYTGILTVADDGDQIIVNPAGPANAKIEFVHHKQPDIPVFPRPSDEPAAG